MFTTLLYTLALVNLTVGNAPVGWLCLTAANLRVIFRK